MTWMPLTALSASAEDGQYMTIQTALILGLTLLSSILLILLISGNRIRKSRRNGGSGENNALLQMGQRLEQLDRLAGQVDEMSRIFHSPRLRGGLGEVLLEDLIRNRLPRDAYAFQYGFSGGQRADAVIRMGSYKVAVDAKFPLEQCESLWERPDQELPRQVSRIFENHARSIADKYILPREGTLSFALMYIPSENLYYRVFIAPGGSLMKELLTMGVLPVGPSALFTYLETVLYGFRGFSFSSRNREMMELIGQLKKDFDGFSRLIRTAGTHLKNFQKTWEESNSRLDGLERTVRRLDDPVGIDDTP